MTIPQSRLANSQITPTIKQRLECLGIPLDRSVKNALVQYHFSQVLTALNHVESNFELIKSPKAVFLYQLPRQPVEQNQPLLPVYTASDFPGYTLQHLKAWYPHHWRQAAQFFGLSVS